MLQLGSIDPMTAILALPIDLPQQLRSVKVPILAADRLWALAVLADG